MFKLSNDTIELISLRISETINNEGLPGCAAVIVHDQDVIWSAGYGHSNLETQQTVDEETVFYLGSITKIFTAIMLMQLRDAGQLQLEDLIASYLPELASRDYPPMTLQQLASHTAGFPVMPPIDDLKLLMAFPPNLDDIRKTSFPSIETIIESLPAVELIDQPGNQLSYSNLGVALLAHALERTAGVDYLTYVREKILSPLGMTRSGSISDVSGWENVAACYFPFADPPQPAPDELKMLGGFAPTGALWSSANDMARFLMALNDRSAAGENVLLSRESLHGMLQPVHMYEPTKGIGTGWFLSQIDQHRVAEHGGADPSAAAYLGWVPELKLGAFIATNTGSNPPAVGACGVDLLDFVAQDMTDR